MINNLIIVRGAGEMASGVIYHLIKAGYKVIALEQENPVCVRRKVCYANAVYEKQVEIEGVNSILAQDINNAIEISNKGNVAVLIDPDGNSIKSLSPPIIIDGRMFKQEMKSPIEKNPRVIGLGPGFIVDENCHATIETNRGENLGKVILQGQAQDYTGIPSEKNNFTHERVLRSPTEGIFKPFLKITDLVNRGDIIGTVNGIKIKAQIEGIIRGLIHENLNVIINQKIGDIDPSGQKELCFKISNKAHTIGRGVIGAVNNLMALR